MAQSLNRVTIIGRVGKDPEIRTLNSGDRVANLSVATSEQWKDRSSGERKEKTEWHKVTVFNDGLVGVIERYVHKGSLIYIEGSLQTRKYTDQSGAERYSTEVVLQKFRGELVLLDGKGEGGSEGRSEARQPTGGGGDGGFSADLDSEIPFATRWGIR